MAEVAGLALAGNIIQFVDFAIKLFKDGQELYRSAEGVSTEVLELDSITQAVRQYAQVLHTAASSRSTARGGLTVISHQCEALADELLVVLEDLKVKNGQNRKWATFKVAVTSTRKRRTIADLEKRLSRMQALMSQFVIGDLRHQQSILLSEIRLFREQNYALEANTTSKLDDIVSQLSSQAKENPSLEDRLGLTALAETSEEVIRKQRVLRRLYFNNIRLRHDIIKPAHAKTFRWIFESSHSNFRDWLQSGDGIYWIAGKAGSGKSTLMKWLVNPNGGRETTLLNLVAWAETKELNVGTHFFWNSGSPLQKSEEGLLRSILFQLCKDVPAVMENLWPPFDEFDYDWDLESFRIAIGRLAHLRFPEDRICIFIDGLDEYSGDHRGLISTIQNLALNPSIKVCASSRPWNVFTDAFANSVNKLKLEDLTREDIKTYVTTNLEEDINFKERESSEPLLRTIADDVTARAQGVFLWVYLVVHSLKKGLIDGARLHEMKELLDSLPSDLEQYFQHMIESIEPQYRQESVRIFKVATVALKPLPLVAYEFIEREQTDPDYALLAPIEPYDRKEIKNIQRLMRKRLNARSKDLLEVVLDHDESFDANWNQLWNFKVDFLHRTVQEFFRKTDCAFETLGKWKPDNFDVELSFLRMSVAFGKASSLLRPIDPNALFFLDECKHKALAIETQYAHESGEDKERLNQEFTLLDAMESIMTSKYEGQFRGELIHCGAIARVEFTDFYPGFIINAGLTFYVAHKLENRHFSGKRREPLLGFALGTRHDLHPPMVKLLLQWGADPNEAIDDHRITVSVWGQYLGNITMTGRGLDSGEDKAALCSVLRMMLEHGADPELLSPYRQRELPRFVREFMESSEMVDLLESLQASRRNDRSILKRFTKMAKVLLKGTEK